MKPTVIIAGLLFTLSTPPSNAVSRLQTTRTFFSLEYRIQQARAVCRGSIAKVKREVLVPRMGERDHTTWPDGIVRYTITVQPREWIKGAPTANPTLVRETSDSDRRFEEWAAASTSFLWFLKDDSAVSSSWDSLRLGPEVRSERSYTTDALPAFSRNLSILRYASAALRRARDFAKEGDAGDKSQRLDISRRMAERCAPSADGNYLLIPICFSTESTARQLIEHPERSLGAGEPQDAQILYELRMAGIGLLRGFPSESAAALLTRLAKHAPTRNERDLAQDILASWAVTGGPSKRRE